MRTPEDLDSRSDPATAGLASLPLPDLGAGAATRLRARCRAALAERGGRGGADRRLYDRVIEPAAVAILGGGVLIATLLRAVAILAAGA